MNILYTFPTYISQEPAKLNINRQVFFSVFSNGRTNFPKAIVKDGSHKTGSERTKIMVVVERHLLAVQI